MFDASVVAIVDLAAQFGTKYCPQEFDQCLHVIDDEIGRDGMESAVGRRKRAALL